MASMGNYALALAESAKKTITGSISGIGAAIKGAARSEMPGINSAYSFAEALKSSANSYSNKNNKDEGISPSAARSAESIKSSSDGANFNAAVVRELQLINENILEQTRLLRYQVDSTKTKSQYDEENAREQALRDSKLLDAINNLGSKGGGKGGGGGNEEGPGIGSALASGAAEGIMNRILGGKSGGKDGGKNRRGGIGGKLVKGAGAVGLGLGALYAYDRVANGGESIAGVAKDLAPGAIGATVGGLVGMIGGPIGVAIGSAIGGAIGDSDFGHKMFETILPDLENYGKIFSQKFQEVGESVTKIFDEFVPTFNNIKDTITSSFTTATNYVVSAFDGIRNSVESSFGEVKNWFTNFKFPDLKTIVDKTGLGQTLVDPKLAKQVNLEMNAPANQAGNVLGNVPNPMGGQAARQAGMRAANASAAATSAVPAPGVVVPPGGAVATPPPPNQDQTKNMELIKAALQKQGITDPKYIAATLGNVMKETGGKSISENLNYSKTSNDRIRSIFGSRAAGKSDAELNEIKSDPKLMGEMMYGSTTKLGQQMGNIEPGDGWKYRGRGFIQLTGKNNYAQASKAIYGDDRLVQNPDLVNYPVVAAEVSAWYMNKGKSAMAAKMGIDEKNMSQGDANLLATSQIAGGDVRKKGSFLAGEVMNKVTAYAGQMAGIAGAAPSAEATTALASATTALASATIALASVKEPSTPASGPVKAPQSPGFNSARDSQVAYDAMPTTPVFTGPGFGSYKEGPNPEADTSFSGSKIPENPQLKVSPLTQKTEEVRLEVRKAANATIKVAEKIGKETANNFKDLAQSSARIARVVAPRNIPIRPILKTPEQIIAEANASFAKAFQKAVPKAFNLALRQALFPKGVGVSQQAAGGALFRGQQLNNIFGVGRGVNKLATSLFGKQYGGMFAPALNNLATGYLEAGARAGGRVLFGMIGGMGAEQSNILTGQILGNYARGNKKLAAEQLIFGTTGVATGYETVFAKYGFKNPMEGVNYMANTLGAAVSDPLGRYMDPNAKASEWIDPRTRKKVSLNSSSSFTTDSYGRYNVPSSQSMNPIGPTWTSGYDREPTVTSMPGGDNALTIIDPIAEEARRQTNDLLAKQNDQIAVDAVRRATDAAEAKYVSESGDQSIVGKLQEVITAISQGRVGSGSTAGGTLGFGGFNPASPLGQVGNMALDFGKVAATNAIYKGLGGKGTNPYTAALANFAISSALKYGGQLAYSYAAPYLAAAGNALVSGAQMAGGYVLNAAGLTGYSAATQAAPIVDGTLAAGGSSLAASSLASSGAASYAGGQSAGTLMGFEGSIGAVAPSTATAAGGSGMLAGMGEAAYALAMNPATWAVVAFIAFAAWMMGDDDDPNPTIQRLLYVHGNNDIAKITTNWVFDIGALNQDQKMAWIAISDQLLRIAFNAAKAFEVKAGTLSTYIGAFEYLGTQINKWGVIIGFYRGTPQAPLPLSGQIDQIDFGTPEEFSKLNANEVARRIVKKVEELYKKGVTHDAKVTEELGKTAEALQKVNYKTLGSGLLESTASKIDTSISRQDFNQMQPRAATSYSVDGEGGPSYYSTPREVYNQQTGEWVIAADESFGVREAGTGRGTHSFSDAGWTFTPEMETYRTGLGRIIGYDKSGLPIYDLNDDNKLTEADFTTNLDTIKSVVASATATNVGNYIANQSAAAAEAEIAASKKTKVETGDNTNIVNSGNPITNNNTSTTIIKRTDSLDILRSASAQTAIPL
jgi:predicted chitinase